MAGHNVMTPGTLAATFPFSPALSQALAGSSPHPHLKRSPYSAALAPTLSSSGLNPNFESPASSAAGTKYLASLLGTDGAVGGVNGSSAALQPEDKEQSKLKNVLKILRSRPGRITEDGIKRLARRAGMQFHTDNTSVKGVHTLIISGTIIVVDIDLRDGSVSRVALSFADTPGPAAEFADRAANILEKTLTPDGYAITSSLARFADNIERFARFDRLSLLPSLNCFNAITGLYVSLIKVWEKESANMGNIEAMCKGMGRPGMHLRGKVGFGIDYWKERRAILSSKGKGRSTEEDESGKYWRVMVDIDEIPNEPFITSVRNSEDWVSDNVLKQKTDGIFAQDSLDIDWIEPPLNNYESVIDPELLQRLNNTRFVARLDPPVVVGIQDEIDIMNATGASVLSQVIPGPLDAVLCPRSNASEALKNERKVYVSKEETSEHIYSLNTLRPAYGRVLEEIPFSHPRQLAIIFQILRKYALFSTLFNTAFDPTNLALPPPSSSTEEMDLDAFLSEGSELTASAVPIDISINALPLGLSLLFPFNKQHLSQVEISIQNNADLVILAVNGNVSADDEQVKKVIEITEDVGILVEFIRLRTKAPEQMEE